VSVQLPACLDILPLATPHASLPNHATGPKEELYKSLLPLQVFQLTLVEYLWVKLPSVNGFDLYDMHYPLSARHSSLWRKRQERESELFNVRGKDLC
jgi:hypothetical protein